MKLTPTVPSAMCLCSVDGFLQMGVPPLRIDISHRADGSTFEEAIAEVAGFDLEGQAISGIGRSALLKNKKPVGREQDLADVRALQRSDPRALRTEAARSSRFSMAVIRREPDPVNDGF